jgi:hypothetical protein
METPNRDPGRQDPGQGSPNPERGPGDRPGQRPEQRPERDDPQRPRSGQQGDEGQQGS